MEEFKERNAQLIELISDEADLIAYNLTVLQDDDVKYHTILFKFVLKT